MGWTRAGWVLSTAVVMGSVCANADAGDDAIDCHARTQRPLDELVVPLADEKFPELPKMAVRIDAGEQMVGAQQSARSRTGNSAVRVGHFDGGVTLGYDVFREGPFSTFVSTGMLWGTVWVDLDATRYEEFESRTAGLLCDDADTVARNSKAVLGEAGVEYRIPLARRSNGPDVGMVLGFRAGYVREIAQSGWVARQRNGEEEEEIGGGPDLDASGMRYRAAVAFALF